MVKRARRLHSLSVAALSAVEIELVREVVVIRHLSVTEIARTSASCWKEATKGRLKNHECRLLLRKLRAGLVNLPPLRESGPRGPRVGYPPRSAKSKLCSLECRRTCPLTLTVFRSGPESALWNELVSATLYGIQIPVGANFYNWWIRARQNTCWLACCGPALGRWRHVIVDWLDLEERARSACSWSKQLTVLILPWCSAVWPYHSLFVRAATPRGLGTLLWLSPAASGDAGRCAVSRHQLSRGELDISGRNAWTWPDGPTPRRPWACGEVHLHLPAVPRRAGSTRRRLRAALDPVGRGVMVNGCISLGKADHRWGGFFGQVMHNAAP